MRITLAVTATFALTLPTLVAGDFNGDGIEDLAKGRGADPNRGS
jgi:hypothetical protein